MGIIAISGRSAGLADRVVILANADDVDSLRIAKHYADKRGVPVDKLSVVFAIVLAAVFLRERLTWQHLAGGALIVSGALLLAWKPAT